MTERESSRRDFLRQSATVAGGGWALMSGTALLAAFDLGCANREAGEFVVLREAEGTELEILTSLIVPSDETPGAREAGVIWFIDAALAGDRAEDVDDLRAGLAGLRDTIRGFYPNRSSLVALTADERLAVMQRIEHGEFFLALRDATLAGLLAHPKHGGNRDKLGWKLIGFDDRHAWQPPFGHYDINPPGPAAS
jgi:gluconate 2-dehydrogenase gamma chain